MAHKFFLNENGTVRGYREDESGLLEIVEIPVIDENPVDAWGYPLEVTNNVEELKGWPDSKAVRIADYNLMLAIQNN